jgi:hypothetical protein
MSQYTCHNCGSTAEEYLGNPDPVHEIGSCMVEADAKKEEQSCKCPHCTGEMVDWDCRCFFEGGCSPLCIYNEPF